jgi:hypothetical protein
MKILNSTYPKLVLLICLMLSITIWSSCKKDENKKSTEIVLLSFGPTGVKHGEQIKFIGENLDKVTAVEFVGASIEAANFLSHTSEVITLVVPALAEKGLVTLKTPAGDIVSKALFDLEVPVVITSISAEARPGAQITIRGNFLNWINEIHFPGDIVVDEFDQISLTELKVTVPNNAKTGILVFSSGGVEPLSIESETELIVTLPQVSSINPSPADHGAQITIRGTDLDLTQSVTVKGVSTPITEFISKSATEIVLTLPAKARKGPITLLPASLVPVISSASLRFVDDVDLVALPYSIYTDALQNGWQNWGWGGAFDFSNDDYVVDGDKAFKVVYSPWGAVKFANVTLDSDSYTTFTFYLYGEVGTEGKELNIGINEFKPEHVITIEEGKWKEYNISLTDLGSPEEIKEIILQSRDFSGTVYFDHVGLK